MHIFKCFFSPHPSDNTLSSSYKTNHPLLAHLFWGSRSTALTASKRFSARGEGKRGQGRREATSSDFYIGIPVPSQDPSTCWNVGGFLLSPAAELLPLREQRFSGEPFPPCQCHWWCFAL